MSAPMPGTPGSLRVLNDQAAVALLLEHGPMSRNELARASGLSKPTAAEMLRRLEAAGLLREAGERTGNRGPNATVHELTTDRFRSVAVDIEGRTVRSVVVDVAGPAFPVALHIMTEAEVLAPADEMLQAAVARACSAAGVDEDAIVAIGVGLQAAVDHASDSLTFIEDMPGWPRHAVAATLGERLGVPVLLENDANLAAVAERATGAGREAGSFALLQLADGVGLALDFGGVVHTGASGAAGEIGYLQADGAEIGDLVSRGAVEDLQREHDVADPATVDADHPFHRALAARVGTALLPALAVADPALVVLHGPTGIAGGAPLAAATARWLRDRTRWVAAVVPPQVVVAPVLEGVRHRLRAHVLSTMQAAVGRLDTPAPSRIEAQQ
ncbi:ROK family transcriptional regulator [Amnibacterium kyonggiense]